MATWVLRAMVLGAWVMLAGGLRAMHFWKFRGGDSVAFMVAVEGFLRLWLRCLGDNGFEH